MVQNGERKPQKAFKLGEWTVYPSLNRLVRADQVEHLEPRVMDALVCLASRPGTVISRDELLETVWPDAVIGEEGLTRQVSSLRKVLGDDRDHPRYIETVRKGGYRLLATVSPVSTAGNEPTPDAEFPAWLPLAALAAAIAAIAAVFWALGLGGGAE